MIDFPYGVLCLIYGSDVRISSLLWIHCTEESILLQESIKQVQCCILMSVGLKSVTQLGSNEGIDICRPMLYL